MKIYKLIHNEKIVYIGRTTVELNKRKNWQYKNNPKLQSIYKECRIELIEETDDISREHYWISFYGKDNLLNMKYGDGINKREQNTLACRKYRMKKQQTK